MHWLGPGRARPILRLILSEMIEMDELDEETALQFARLILHDNAARVYGMASSNPS